MSPKGLLNYLYTETIRHLLGRANFSQEGKQQPKEISEEEITKQKRLLLADLSTDVIYAIADQLDDLESRVLLSLTCKRLHRIFNTNKNITRFKDDSTKFRFLQIYERDLPDDFTCRLCCRLIKWRPFEHPCDLLRHLRISYSCAHHPRYPMALWLHTETQVIPLSRELIDLILKADELGEQYGIPVAVLDKFTTGGTTFSGTRTEYKVRLVKGELLLFMSLRKEVASWKEAGIEGRGFTEIACLHYSGSHGVPNDIEATLSKINIPGETDLFKCPCCRTQYRLSLRTSLSVNALVVVQIKIWKNFGSRYDNSICNEQMFTFSNVVVSNLLQRDLEAEFELESRHQSWELRD